MENEIYVRIYTKDNNNILVFEGCEKMNKDYYYPHGSVFGSGVTGKEHISITDDAKKLFKRIVNEAEHTGDDLSCLDIYKIREKGIHISWIGGRNHEIDIRNLDEDGFFIGIGEGAPRLELLDELTE